MNQINFSLLEAKAESVLASLHKEYREKLFQEERKLFTEIIQNKKTGFVAYNNDYKDYNGGLDGQYSIFVECDEFPLSTILAKLYITKQFLGILIENEINILQTKIAYINEYYTYIKNHSEKLSKKLSHSDYINEDIVIAREKDISKEELLHLLKSSVNALQKEEVYSLHSNKSLYICHLERYANAYGNFIGFNIHDPLYGSDLNIDSYIQNKNVFEIAYIDNYRAELYNGAFGFSLLEIQVEELSDIYGEIETLSELEEEDGRDRSEEKTKLREKARRLQEVKEKGKAFIRKIENGEANYVLLQEDLHSLKSLIIHHICNYFEYSNETRIELIQRACNIILSYTQ